MKVSLSHGSRWFCISSYMKSPPAMLPVVAQDHKLMKRLSSRKAIMTRMERPTWRDLKLTAFMAPAETPHTLAKSLIRGGWGAWGGPGVEGAGRAGG